MVVRVRLESLVHVQCFVGVRFALTEIYMSYFEISVFSGLYGEIRWFIMFFRLRLIILVHMQCVLPVRLVMNEKYALYYDIRGF